MITLTTEQAQQIEGALEGVKPLLMGTDTVDKALAAIREQKAELEKQEPVAWMIESTVSGIGFRSDEPPASVKATCKCTPLYAAPVSIHSESETDSSSSSMRTAVRTKDLTDDEIEAAVLPVNTTMEAWITYRAVIAADRKLNGVEK